MEKPVTINLDQEVLERALRLAEEKNKSLSDFVSELLSDFVRNEGRTKEELLSIIHKMAGSYGPSDEPVILESDITPSVRELMGIVTLPDDFDYKKTRGEYLMNKYFGKRDDYGTEETE